MSAPGIKKYYIQQFLTSFQYLAHISTHQLFSYPNVYCVDNQMEITVKLIKRSIPYVLDPTTTDLPGRQLFYVKSFLDKKVSNGRFT